MIVIYTYNKNNNKSTMFLYDAKIIINIFNNTTILIFRDVTITTYPVKHNQFNRYYFV